MPKCGQSESRSRVLAISPPLPSKSTMKSMTREKCRKTATKSKPSSPTKDDGDASNGHEEKKQEMKDTKMTLSDLQKEEFAKLFSSVLKNMIETKEACNECPEEKEKEKEKDISESAECEHNNNDAQNNVNHETKQNEEEREREDTLSTLSLAERLNENKLIDIEHDGTRLPFNRAKRKLLAISPRDQAEHLQRRQYLQPLDKLECILLICFDAVCA